MLWSEETALLYAGPARSRSAGLVEQTGRRFSERDCEVAARTGRLAGIVQVAVERRHRGARSSGSVPVSTLVALARARARERL